MISNDDYFQLPVFSFFGQGPYHMHTVRQEFDIPKLRKGLGKALLRSYTLSDPSSPEKPKEEHRRLLFRLAGDVFCELDRGAMTVFASTAELAAYHAKELSARFGRPKPRQGPLFFLMSIRGAEVDAQSVEITQPFVLNDPDLALHYGREFVEFERELLSVLRSQHSGASIFRGEPGTGKTSFIRHLISKLQPSHRFYYLPVHACGFLSAPEWVGFWTRQTMLAPDKKKIVVIEDAEELLMVRGPGNRAKVSDLLNVADGLLGEFLKMHVLCTTNCPMERLDPAVMRSGRLVAHREFARLKPEQARRIAVAKGLQLHEDQPDYSLAEIYKGRLQVDGQGWRPRIGFEP
ncbi:MAG: AAA family ATPase [Verrucomicrobiales bacterium]|nr:AAA family ATPase [Verrucomicrobiales bacterium]